MTGFNRVILAGNLTRDPELRYTPKGTGIAEFGLALNREWKDEGGAAKKEVTFIDCETWGKQAEALAQYKKKGDPVLVEGRLKLEQWEKNGEKRSKVVVVAESVSFLPTPNGGNGNQNAPAGKRGANRPAAVPHHDQRD